MPTPRPLAFALCLALIASLSIPVADAAKKKKSSPKKAETSLACSDFYAQANSDWLKANVVTGSGMQSALGQLAQRAQQQQIDLLNADMQSTQAGVPKLLGDFWASGLDEAAVERDGANPIAPLLSRVDAIRRSKDVPPAIAALHQVGIPVAFNFSADVDLQDLSRHIGYFSQGGLGLPDPAYYTRTDADTRALLGRYTDYVSKILALTGSKPADLKADTQAVLDIESRIAQASRPLSMMGDPRTNYAKVAANTLGKQYKHLQLDDFLKVQGVSDDSVSMANPQLFAQLDMLVDRLKPEQWKTYLRYQVGVAMAHGEHVKEVHDLHLWELAPGHPILTAHVLVAPGEDCHAVRRALERMLNERFKIAHTTLQVDHAHQQLLSIQRHGVWPSSTS